MLPIISIHDYQCYLCKLSQDRVLQVTLIGSTLAGGWMAGHASEHTKEIWPNQWATWFFDNADCILRLWYVHVSYPGDLWHASEPRRCIEVSVFGIHSQLTWVHLKAICIELQHHEYRDTTLTKGAWSHVHSRAINSLGTQGNLQTEYLVQIYVVWSNKNVSRRPHWNRLLIYATPYKKK